ncbi:hypothetical protein COW80_03335 [Candidatus Beckwithbacteria bacterium CG22_combo_CG10-13_8_21_14_all_01_47_9]|uniref:Phosphoribosyl pyrophosphate synthase n=2 Tax=Candidatus Beckwithiibacteriota TaxID=1752726 RepID=A0A2H0E0E3_9BACT|nr:MAG: hypothetical protein AUJ59_01760 [Candidatus Beckwithbacteria bacterium CG1_02_47_37]PIP87882.1 MAG: hypothetical protein COW80_03335 [Candidatus Beckwithbacteria bacterium CG22_combo_CG10-13_8_21_14_all_01_47_9]
MGKDQALCLNPETFYGFDPDKITSKQVLSLWCDEQKTWGSEQPLTIFLSPVDEPMVLNENLLVDKIRIFPDRSTAPHFANETRKMVNGRNIVLIVSMGGNGGAKDKDVRTAARYYRSFGATKILVEATKFLDSREDREFPNEAPTLFAVVKGFSDDRMPDGTRTVAAMVLPDNHSSALFRMAAGLKFPAIGMTGYRFMIRKSGLTEAVRQIGQEFFAQLAPDANRHKTAHSSAEELGIEVVSCRKARDTESGKLIMLNRKEVMARLKNKKHIVVFDDEIATSDTIQLLMNAAAEANPEMEATVLAMHNNLTAGAIVNLKTPVIKRILISDTMMPSLSDEDRNHNVWALPLVPIPVGESLIKVGEHLMTGGSLANLPEGWLPDPWLQ